MRRWRFLGAFHNGRRDCTQAVLCLFQRARQAIDLCLLARHGIAHFLQRVFLKRKACLEFNESLLEIRAIGHDFFSSTAFNFSRSWRTQFASSSNFADVMSVWRNSVKMISLPLPFGATRIGL